VGATFDASRVSYRQNEQEGSFDDSRGVSAGAEPAELSASVAGDSASACTPPTPGAWPPAPT